MSSDTDFPAISIHDIGKCYHLWDSPKDRLKQPLRTMLSRWLPVREKRYFREFWALRNLSFDVGRGESIGIIGKNGSGKSTLLQIICGTLAPTTGSIEIRGRIGALLELGSGFNPEFSGKENVYMNASVLGLKKEEIDEQYEAILEFADIGDFIHQPVKTYSSGMYVRLAFAIAAHVHADILVIDEALAVGDAFFAQKCMRYLRTFLEQGTLLFVSHDTAAVINLCDRAILLDGGMIQAQGSARDICDLYLEKVFAARQDVNRSKNSVRELPAPIDPEHTVDQRLKYINASPLRNDIEVFRFDPHAQSFGNFSASIIDVKFLERMSREPLSWIVGGESVCLRIACMAHADIMSPIVGFYVRDRLGQTLFGDNTYLTYSKNPLLIKAGERFEAEFCFRMPILLIGDYSITAAVAEGSQEQHVQQHWMHDALFFKSHSTSNWSGLIGVPMEKISLRVHSE